MTDYRDGNIYGWNGGECPVHPKDEVRFWLRASDGGMMVVPAGSLGWTHDGYSDDIIAFQVVKEHEEPMTLWVNIYNDGDVLAFASKDAAERGWSATLGRIAVPFREVTE